MGADCEQCFARLFPVESLEDGAAIMGHDAVATATWSLRFNGVNDSPARIAQVFKRLHGPDAVPLASGWLSLSPGGDPTRCRSSRFDRTEGRRSWPSPHRAAYRACPTAAVVDPRFGGCVGCIEPREWSEPF